jgi:lipopolysaccharide/colanic/teichoic acid biosynthesis glycosyltransferase
MVVAIGIKLDSPGPVLFRQPRIGRGGHPFKVVKFRTMRVGAERQRAELMRHSRNEKWLDLAHDPRVTRFGRLLRRSSLDELPQLFNVLRGEMSMVGPRPLPEEEDAQVGERERSRLDLTPGITGLWQVLGRNEIPFDEMVKLDYIYVTNWSLWMDVRLLMRTLPAVLARRGVN